MTKGELKDIINECIVEIINENNIILNISEYYRVEYEGIGIYEAFKKNVSGDIWLNFKNSEACNWLPQPTCYGPANRSYFTKLGYNTFKSKTLPYMIKYLDKNKIKVNKIKADFTQHIIYQDKYQIVTDVEVH